LTLTLTLTTTTTKGGEKRTEIEMANMTARAVALAPPLDYSFCELPDIESMLDDIPRSGKTKVQVGGWMDGWMGDSPTLYRG
jgi:hypothetical protein